MKVPPCVTDLLPAMIADCEQGHPCLAPYQFAGPVARAAAALRWLERHGIVEVYMDGRHPYDRGFTRVSLWRWLPGAQGALEELQAAGVSP